MYKVILFEKKDGIAKITLNRPDQMNALNDELVREMTQAFEDANKDDSIKVIIYTGAGKAFCAGGDLKFFLGITYKDTGEFYRWHQMAYEMFNNNVETGKIVIGAVNGYCFAGGFELISTCDIVIASDNAVLGDEHINRGLIPGGFSVFRWGRILGPRKAKEILLTGARLTAREAEQVGIVNKVVPRDKLDEEVDKIARNLASKNMGPLMMGKKYITRAMDFDLTTHSHVSMLELLVREADFVQAGGVSDFVGKKAKK